ncbi:hypothetical protein Vafri_3192 [Volvox africanus]|uniref:Uncharacterized protein n=1 Tax=Volvox africanus TaxID=51714 RepID=A0A8J4ESL4_9CHLO|nr:hypothetical protein Vafri_3192 [Volvox africanus]
MMAGAHVAPVCREIRPGCISIRRRLGLGAGGGGEGRDEKAEAFQAATCAVAAAVVHLHGGGGTSTGETIGVSDDSGSYGEDTESDNNCVASSQDPGVGVSTASPPRQQRDTGLAVLKHTTAEQLYCAVRQLIQ